MYAGPLRNHVCSLYHCKLERYYNLDVKVVLREVCHSLLN